MPKDFKSILANLTPEERAAALMGMAEGIKVSLDTLDTFHQAYTKGLDDRMTDPLCDVCERTTFTGIIVVLDRLIHDTQILKNELDKIIGSL